MGKAMTFSLNGQRLTAVLEPQVSKRDLYGYSKKIIEKEGHRLVRGYLSPEGQLIRHREIASVRLDPEGTPIEEPTVLIAGNPALYQPSAFERDNLLEPVPLTCLIGFNVSTVYPLVLEDPPIPPGLYATAFAYRKSYILKDAYLLVKDELVKDEKEAYLLVGVAKKTTFVGLTVTYDFFDAEEIDEGDEDELDFAMF
jgi:hypothetical protein